VTWIRPAIVLALASLIAACGDGGGTRPASIDVADVLSEERTIVDASRPTRANGDAPASNVRTLVTRLWYSPSYVNSFACRRQGCALVLLAHGFGGRTERFDSIGRLLAASGYIVAAPTFPLTNQDAPGGQLNGLSDAVEQPADLSAVISALLAATGDPQDPLFGRIDGARIGALGHSLGGTTVIGATHTACCADPRLDAAVLVAPAAFAVNAYFGAITPDGAPLLTINGSDDPLIMPSASLAFARSLTPPWYFLEIPGVGHVLLIENIGDPQPPLYVTAHATLAFFDEFLGGVDGAAAAALEELVADGNIAEFLE
jgi:dienelactone hydrolase